MSDELFEAVKMYTGVGLSPKQIAATLQINKLAVSILQRRAGINPRPRRDRVVLSLTIIEKILELYREHGAPFISKELNVPIHDVYLVLRARGAGRPFKRQGRVGGATVAAKLALKAKKAIILERRDVFERALANEFHISLGLVRSLLRRRRA